MKVKDANSTGLDPVAEEKRRASKVSTEEKRRASKVSTKPKLVRNIYKACYHFLARFCDTNVQCQADLLPYLDIFLAQAGYGLGVCQLLLALFQHNFYACSNINGNETIATTVLPCPSPTMILGLSKHQWGM